MALSDRCWVGVSTMLNHRHGSPDHFYAAAQTRYTAMIRTDRKALQRQATATWRRRRRNAAPVMAKPLSIIAHVAGSGTAGV